MMAELWDTMVRRGDDGCIAAASGGDECVRWHRGERAEEGTRPGKSERGSRGLRGIVDGVQGDEAAAGSRRWPGAWPARDEHAPSVLLVLG